MDERISGTITCKIVIITCCERSNITWNHNEAINIGGYVIYMRGSIKRGMVNDNI